MNWPKKNTIMKVFHYGFESMILAVIVQWCYVEIVTNLRKNVVSFLSVKLF